MPNRLPKILTLLSLLLALAFSLLCARSLFASDALSRHAVSLYPDHRVISHFSITSLRWRILIRYTIDTSASFDSESAAPQWNFQSAAPDNPQAYFTNPLGLAASWSTHTFGPLEKLQGGSLMFPHLALVFLFALLPLHVAFRFLRRRRIQPNHCPTCNYDLRAHAPNAICPECGTRIPLPANHPAAPSPSLKNP